VSEIMHLNKLDGYMAVTCAFPPLGGVQIQTSRGPVLVADAAGFTTIRVNHDDSPSIAVLVYDPAPDAEQTGTGYIVQMTPEQARHAGASLIHLANLADGGRAQ
jgi:hypothetical protein